MPAQTQKPKLYSLKKTVFLAVSTVRPLPSIGAETGHVHMAAYSFRMISPQTKNKCWTKFNKYSKRCTVYTMCLGKAFYLYKLTFIRRQQFRLVFVRDLRGQYDESRGRCALNTRWRRMLVSIYSARESGNGTVQRTQSDKKTSL